METLLLANWHSRTIHKKTRAQRIINEEKTQKLYFKEKPMKTQKKVLRSKLSDLLQKANYEVKNLHVTILCFRGFLLQVHYTGT